MKHLTPTEIRAIRHARRMAKEAKRTGKKNLQTLYSKILSNYKTQGGQA